MCYLIEYRRRTGHITYHLATSADGKVLCGRRLDPKRVNATHGNARSAIKIVAKYDRPGSDWTLNGCAQCHAKSHVLFDAVTRLGTLA